MGKYVQKNMNRHTTKNKYSFRTIGFPRNWSILTYRITKNESDMHKSIYQHNNKTKRQINKAYLVYEVWSIVAQIQDSHHHQVWGSPLFQRHKAGAGNEGAGETLRRYGLDRTEAINEEREKGNEGGEKKMRGKRKSVWDSATSKALGNHLHQYECKQKQRNMQEKVVKLTSLVIARHNLFSITVARPPLDTTPL